MNRFPAELSNFFLSIWKNWLSLMSGILGVFVWAIGASLEPMPVSLRWTFLVCGTVALLVSSFFAWRDMYREARPYEEETFRHAQTVFAGLAESQKASLEQLAIRKNVPCAQMMGSGNKLELTGFVKRDHTLGTYSIQHDYLQIIPRLVKEWRSQRRLA